MFCNCLSVCSGLRVYCSIISSQPDQCSPILDSPDLNVYTICARLSDPLSCGSICNDLFHTLVVHTGCVSCAPYSSSDVVQCNTFCNLTAAMALRQNTRPVEGGPSLNPRISETMSTNYIKRRYTFMRYMIVNSSARFLILC